MFRLAPRLAATRALTSSARLLGKYKPRPRTARLPASLETPTITVGSYLRSAVGGEGGKVDWARVRSEVVGLPTGEESRQLVNKVNMETVLWREVEQLGDLGLALSLQRDRPPGCLVDGERSLLTAMQRAEPEQLERHEAEIIPFVEKIKAREAVREPLPPLYWVCVEILGRTTSSPKHHRLLQEVIAVMESDRGKREQFCVAEKEEINRKNEVGT